MAKPSKLFVSVALDQFGLPRAWGMGMTAEDAVDECARQAAAYQHKKLLLGERVELRVTAASLTK